jgi:YggT family protein
MCGCRRSGGAQDPCSPFTLIRRGEAMSILGSNLLSAVASVLGFALNLYMWIIIARAVLSWVSPDPYNPIVRFVHGLTEPVLYQVRRRLPASFGGLDLSPVIVLMAIMFLERFVVESLYQMAADVR